MRALPDPDEEPEVVRAPPEPREEEEEGGAQPRTRRPAPGQRNGLRGGRVAPPPRPGRPPAGAGRARPPVIETPGLVRPVDDDEDDGPPLRPRARRPAGAVVVPAEELPEEQAPAAEPPPKQESKPKPRDRAVVEEADGVEVEEVEADAAKEEVEEAEPAAALAEEEDEEGEAEQQTDAAIVEVEDGPEAAAPSAEAGSKAAADGEDGLLEAEEAEELEEEGPEPLLAETPAAPAETEEEEDLDDGPERLLEEDPEVVVEEEEGSELEEPAVPGLRLGLYPPSQRSGRARALTEVIAELGFASAEQVAAATEQARDRGINPEQALLEMGAINEDQLARALAERFGFDYIDLTIFQVDPAATSLLSSQAARRYQAVPVALLEGGEAVLVAMADPSNVVAMDDIGIMTGKEVRAAVASRQDVADLIARMDSLEPVVDEGLDEEDLQGEALDVRETAEDAPVVKLVNQIVAQAVQLGASDLHLAPTNRDLRVRFRIDGVLRDVTAIPRRMAGGVISRIKIMAELDIAERRLPQDGRVGLNIDGHHVDLRVVTLPSAKGEAVVMRILDKDSVVMELDRLGMAADDRERFEHAFHLSHGAVLVTGPTGSGKTTTLYAALTKLNTKERNIITIEDPVEYQLDGVTQVQVYPKVGLTFAVGLRTMVRADPDVIMVGEIRDRETAQIAVESALTGHLVLSTLHTNDAPSAIHRLIEMGIEPFLVSSAVECVLAQRLARTLCPHCKRKTVVSAEALRANGFAAKRDIEAYEPVGCGRCGNTGYRGRIAIYEVMTMSRELRELALARRSADEIRDVAISQGMRRMRDDGLEKVRRGVTSLPEILRVIGSTT